MTQKEKQLLIIDLCARLPYELNGLHRGKVQRLLIIDSFGSYQVNDYATWFHLDSVPFKPYLRPMSSMTKEEADEFEKISNELLENGESTEIWDTVVDWLNEHHFDHRGLIPMGLALEASEEMYK